MQFQATSTLTTMKKTLWKFLLLCLTVLTTTTICGQTKENNLINDEMTFELKGDTLYSTTGLKLFVGQQLTLGEASGIDGHFRSIISKKAAIVPSIWGQDKRYENAIENYVDSKKNKEKLRKFLTITKSLTIKGIGLSKTGKPHFYMVLLSADTGECKADIKLALRLKELLLQQ
jgi:hypothetical protein